MRIGDELPLCSGNSSGPKKHRDDALDFILATFPRRGWRGPSRPKTRTSRPKDAVAASITLTFCHGHQGNPAGLGLPPPPRVLNATLQRHFEPAAAWFAHDQQRVAAVS